MIGERTIKIGERKVSLRFDWAAVEDFCEAEGVNFSEMTVAMQSPKKMRMLIHNMAKSAGEDIEADELRGMSFTELSIVTELIAEAMGEGKGGGKRVK